MGIRLLVQFGNLFVLARLLGPDQFGAFVSLSALAIFLGNFATFGAHVTLVRDLARDEASRESVLPSVLGMTAVCGGGLLLSYLTISALFLAADYSVGISVAICIGAAELLLQPLLTISAVERMSTGGVAEAQLLRMLPLPLQLLVALFIWLFEVTDPLEFYAWGYVSAATLALAISLRTLPRPWPGIQRWTLPSRKRWRGGYGFALASLTASGPTELDKTFAARLLPLELAGIYSVAARIAGALTTPVSSMMLSVMPSMFRESGRGGPSSGLTCRIFISTLGYGMIAGTVMFLVAPHLGALLGPAYLGAEVAMQWLAIIIPPLSLRLAAVNVLLSTDRPLMRAAIEGFGILVLLVCGILLVPSNGLQGMVIAVACAEVLMAMLGWVWILLRIIRFRSNSLTAPDA